MAVHLLFRNPLSRSLLWFRLWLLLHRPEGRCPGCRSMGRDHIPCFAVSCHCRCSRVEGFRP